jgi:hypothetical protein
VTDLLEVVIDDCMFTPHRLVPSCEATVSAFHR